MCFEVEISAIFIYSRSNIEQYTQASKILLAIDLTFLVELFRFYFVLLQNKGY